ARLELNKIDRHVQTAVCAVKDTAAYNILADRLGLAKRNPQTGRHPYRKLFTSVAQGDEELSEEDQNAVIGVLSNHVANIAEDQPEKLAKLRGDIELVTLEVLIKRYEEMLDAKLA